MPTTPSSTPSSDAARAGRFLAVGALVLALALSGLVARTVWFDAYWTFRREPPWLAVTGGSNSLLDDQTRRGKILQALSRSYTVALIGSSTTYNGLDPADVDVVPEGDVFNVGISALIAEELPAVAAVVASRGGVDRVSIGLDYYMFSRPEVPVALDPSLATPSGRLATRMGSLVSRYAIADSRLSRVEGGDSGRWTYAGFHLNPMLSPEATREVHEARVRMTAPYRPATLRHLALALERLAPRRIGLYLSPVSDAQRSVLAELRLQDDFERWRRDVAALASAHGLTLVDLADLGARYPFDPDAGSNSDWFDNLHFTPRIGRLVLQRIGLRDAARTSD